MIVGVGCDIVEHQVAKDSDWNSNNPALNRIFSKEEMDIYLLLGNIRFLCGRFAAKEAVLKCLGTGMEDGIALTDIQILQSEKKSPLIVLSGRVKEIAENFGIDIWNVSISHSMTQSLAFVIAENNKYRYR